MANASFGGTGGSAYTGYTITSGPIGLVGGRTCANGGVYALMTGLYAQVGGNGATRNVTLQLGGGAINLNVPNDSHPVAQYGGGVSWLFNGGSYNLVATPSSTSASVNYDRGGGGTTTTSGGSSFPGTVGGFYSYVLPPTAPQSLSGTPHSSSSGSINLSWTAPSDNGGSSLTAYTVLRDGVIIAHPGTTSYTDTGRTPGTSYSYVVRARNAVTDAASTQSVNSNTVSVTAPGVPTAPQSLTATPSTSVTGRINLSWSAPATPGAGGITGYNVFRNGTQIAVLTGTGTTYSATGLTPYTSYDFTVKARNAFADATSTLSAASNLDAEVAPGPPGPPTGLSAIADGLVPGKIDLSWTAPAVTGAGGITGYSIYFSGGALINATTGTGTTYSVTGLNPGQTYTFVVYARNALADAEGSKSAASNTAIAQALGEPNSPTSFAVTPSAAVANRLVLSWVAPAGTLTGYNIFERNTVTLVDTLIASISAANTSYMIDGLTVGVPKTYFVRARNSYTDTLPTGYPGNYGGVASSLASGTPTANTSQAVGSLSAVTDITNQNFIGTFQIAAVTPSTVRYAVVAANVASVASGGTIADNTNAIFNGTYTIATPTDSTFTYSKVNANIPTIAVSAGTITDNTNVSFNGTKTVTAVNVGAKTVSYARVDSAVSSVAVPTNTPPGGRGTIINNTNAVFNGTNFAINVPSLTTMTYAVTNANIAESAAGGTVVDATNRDVFNGTYIVTTTPEYNNLTYAKVASNVSGRNIYEPLGKLTRTTSESELSVKYRSGWAG